MDKVNNAYSENEVFPSKGNIFNAFDLTKLENVKVVILGQDPYHGINQAMGLAFSVPSEEKIPPSLVNIFKEINKDYDCKFVNGDLTKWAMQGVLLLNTTLTVNSAQPNSHKDYGWTTFTDNAISFVSDNTENVVFMLWGNHAKSKKNLIDEKHLVLESSHPSPLGAYRGFNGCRHFSKANDYLRSCGKTQIDWQN